MTRLRFRLTLGSDVVITEDGATAGSHRSLDYVPGSVILGVCARRAYSALGEFSYGVFHSGAVRFSNAYPVSSTGAHTVPIPRSWNSIKGSKWHPNGVIVPDEIVNTATPSHQVFDNLVRGGHQLEQLGGGYVGDDGRYAKPTLPYRMKTAIDRSARGRASEAQLFGYEAIPAGTELVFHVDIDDEIAEIGENVMTTLSEALSGDVRIGRSRGVEYGAARIEPDSDYEPPRLLTPRDDRGAGTTGGGLLLVFCVSDVALVSAETGLPVLTPAPEHFGLSDASVDWARTAIRYRSYTPYNGKRQAPDRERQVIAAGSVITFKVAYSAVQGAWATDCERRGVGACRQDGLGWIAVNPRLLADERPGFEQGQRAQAGDVRAVGESAIPNEPADPLIAWLRAAGEGEAISREAEALVHEWWSWIDPLIRALSRDDEAPSATQWKQLRQVVGRAGTHGDLQRALWQGGSGMFVHGETKRAWTDQTRLIKVGDKSERLSIGSYLKGRLFHDESGGPPAFAAAKEALLLLADRAHRLTKELQQ